MTVLLLLSVVLGALSQRLTGMGFALVACPLLVIVLGASDGVMVVNLCGAVSAAIVLTRLWRRVDWRSYRRLTFAAVIGILPGAWLAVTLAGPWLEIVGGLVLIGALIVSLVVTRTTLMVSGKRPAIVAGFVSGMMNAAAGVGGPAVSAYAVLSRWKQKHFAATLQPYFLTIGLTSLGTKLVLASAQAPRLDWWIWVLIVGAIFAGIASGDRLAHHVSAHRAHLAVVVISFAGAVVAIGNGIMKLRA